METSKGPNAYSVGVLVVSDTVYVGEKEDSSGVNLVKLLNGSKYFSVSAIEEYCVADNISDIEDILKLWSDTKKIDLILTVGGTGFTPRDVTPEATRKVIDKEAQHLATFMVMGCCEKTKFAALSRSVCGVRRNSLILNLPGSIKGSSECFEMVASLLPHVLDQLKGQTESVAVAHSKIQKDGYVTK